MRRANVEVLRCLLLFVAFTIVRGAPAQEPFWQPTGGPNGSEGRAVEISPDGVVYVGTFKDGVYRSGDQGETWAFFGLDHVHAVYDFAFSEDFVFAATWNGVYRTSPEDSRWELMAEGTAFSIEIGRDGIVFVGSHDGSVLRSEDGGISWADASQGLGGSPVEPDALEIHEDGRVLVGTAGACLCWRPIFRGGGSHPTRSVCRPCRLSAATHLCLCVALRIDLYADFRSDRQRVHIFIEGLQALRRDPGDVRDFNAPGSFDRDLS